MPVVFSSATIVSLSIIDAGAMRSRIAVELRHPFASIDFVRSSVACPCKQGIDALQSRATRRSLAIIGRHRLQTEWLSSRVTYAGDMRSRWTYHGGVKGRGSNRLCLRQLSGDDKAVCQGGADVAGVEGVELEEMRDERGVDFALGKSFYREESALGRDLGVLAAALHREQTGRLRVLDAMSGCGVRAARYLAHARADFVWANDAFEDLGPALDRNLRTAADAKPPSRLGVGSDDRGGGGTEERWKITHEDANRVLLGRYIAKDYFDLVDVDSFGSESWFLGSALSMVTYGGMLYATSTDGFSSGGHRPLRALAAYGAYVRPLPFGNELGLRMLIGGAVREGATRGLSVLPVFSHYSFHGPVFRCMLRVTSEGGTWQSRHYSFVGHCFACGNSRIVPWTDLGGATCECHPSKPMAVCGPLWTGPLHSHADVAAMAELAREWSWRESLPSGGGRGRGGRGSGTGRGQDRRRLGDLLDVMLEESDERLPPWYIELDRISKIGRVPTPRRADLMEALKLEGYAASRSHVEATALKTNASMATCIEISKRIALRNARAV